MELPFDESGTEPQRFTVTGLTQALRMLIEEELGDVRVQGEISNHRRQASGHQYFTLKDAGAQIACVMFQRQAWANRLALADGMEVQVDGRMTVYEARGQYQIVVEKVRAAGAGLLQAKFEALKRKLAGEGLFDPAHKQPLPRFPEVIGVITSPTGAAIQDMLNVLQRRAPWVRVLICPVRVQGSGASVEIASAIAAMNSTEVTGFPAPDILVVARGGGSAEDLWEFNEERVARAIFASQIPVVSAVGHEIDFTIADFVADLRAPTPSAAAELIVPDQTDLLRHLSLLLAKMDREVRGCIRHQQARLAGASRAALFLEPRRRIESGLQTVDRLAESLERCSHRQIAERKQRVEQIAAILRQHRPEKMVTDRRMKLAELLRRMNEASAKWLTHCRQKLAHRADLLRLLSPDGTLQRGYTITLGPDGRVVRTPGQLRAEDEIETRFAEGRARSRVIED